VGIKFVTYTDHVVLLLKVRSIRWAGYAYKILVEESLGKRPRGRPGMKQNVDGYRLETC